MSIPVSLMATLIEPGIYAVSCPAADYAVAVEAPTEAEAVRRCAPAAVLHYLHKQEEARRH